MQLITCFLTVVGTAKSSKFGSQWCYDAYIGRIWACAPIAWGCCGQSRTNNLAVCEDWIHLFYRRPRSWCRRLPCETLCTRRAVGMSFRFGIILRHIHYFFNQAKVKSAIKLAKLRREKLELEEQQSRLRHLSYTLSEKVRLGTALDLQEVYDITVQQLCQVHDPYIILCTMRCLMRILPFSLKQLSCTGILICGGCNFWREIY